MSKTFRAWDVDQRVLFPASAGELVPRDHLAHFVRELVRGELDLGPILATYDEERGQPPYHPAMMTALLLYAYCRGVYSSRKIETGCAERVDFMAVTGMAKPDHSTISGFRKEHLGALAGLFTEVLDLCREAGMAKLGHVALDGTKVLANASKHRAMSYGRMRAEEPRLAEEVDGWLRRAEEADREEDAAEGEEGRAQRMPEWASRKEERLARIREAKARLEERARDRDREGGGSGGGPPADREQVNFTDPDSRVMRTRGTYEQSYNCQLAVDAAGQVVVAADVTQRQNDSEELAGMLEAVRAEAGELPREMSADANYCSEENLRLLRRKGVRGYVATGRMTRGRASATDRGTKRGRLTMAMRRRLKLGGWRSRYRLRKITVEPVVGQIKEARGFRRFLLRGLGRVRAEWRLVCTVHNLLKLAGARRAAARA